MFTRMLDHTVKPGKVEEFNRLVRDELFPVLRHQGGFLDAMVLVSETEPDNIVLMTYWDDRACAEDFEREQFPAVLDKLERLLKSEPLVRTFEVEHSTVRLIAAGRAA
jgi:quinol monooxygenase YgiN